MAKLDMKPGETMIGSGQMSLYQKQGLTKKPFQGNVFVTNQRACFKISVQQWPIRWFTMRCWQMRMALSATISQRNSTQS